MTEKRFNLVGSYLYDGETVISHFNDPLHRDEIVDLLNQQHEQIQQLKQTIREAYTNERTQIGRNVLKQLLERIE